MNRSQAKGLEILQMKAEAQRDAYSQMGEWLNKLPVHKVAERCHAMLMKASREVDEIRKARKKTS